jgi:hypothetical protein
LGNLVEAAQQMPGHFMGQLSEEVLGMDLSQPLAFERSKEDCAKCDMPATAKGGEATAATAKGGDDNAALLNKTQFTEDDFAVDQVAPFDVDPEFVASLNLQEGGEVEFGESNDPANSMEAIKAELGGGETEGDVPAGAVADGEKAGGGCCDDEQSAEAKLQEMMAQKPEGAEGTQKQGQPAKEGDIPANMKTIGPLTVGQRARYMANQMMEGVKQWFSANWPKLLAGAIAALAAFVGLNILTGGAITAALPALMQVVAVVMGGVALANIAGHVGSYLSQGWAGNIGGAAKSLARGLAAGAVELVFALLFNAGAVIKALKGGLKGTVKAVTGAAKNTVKTTVKSVKELGQIGLKGAKTALKNGKIMLQGVKGGFAKGAKSLDDLARQLVGKLRFNKFKITFRNRVLTLWGHINPWKKLASTPIEVDSRINTLKTSGKLKVARIKGSEAKTVDELLEDIATRAKNGQEGALGEIAALERKVLGQSEEVELLFEVPSGGSGRDLRFKNKPRKNPDFRVSGQDGILEIKTARDVPKDWGKWLKSHISGANTQIKRSGLVRGKPGSAEFQLYDDAATNFTSATPAEIHTWITREFRSDQMTNLRRVAIYTNGNLFVEYTRLADNSIAKTFP